MKVVNVPSAFTPFYTDTYAKSLVMLNKLESPENIVVGGQEQEEAGSLYIVSHST